MKVLQINREYHTGSTGKITEDIHKYLLSKGIDSVVCYGRGPLYKAQSVHKVSSELEAKIHSALSRMSGVDFGYSFYATSKLIKIIKQESPDVVHIHCLNGHFVNAYRLLDFLKKNKIKTIITLHAEIMHTAGCEHAMDCEKWKTECNNCPLISGKISHYFRDDAKLCFKKIKKIYDGFEDLTIVGVSDWLTQRAMMSGVFSDCKPTFKTINNGTRFVEATDHLKNNKPVILHVTPDFLHPLKGGKYVVELAKLHPEWQFIIVGTNCEIANQPENIQMVGRIKDRQVLANYYASADVTLITSKRETFSMVCLESLSCGTPIVGFKSGGPESVFIGDYVRFVDYGNVTELSNMINFFLQKKIHIDIKELTNRFSIERMADSYLLAYSK